MIIREIYWGQKNWLEVGRPRGLGKEGKFMNVVLRCLIIEHYIVVFQFFYMLKHYLERKKEII